MTAKQDPVTYTVKWNNGTRQAIPAPLQGGAAKGSFVRQRSHPEHGAYTEYRLRTIHRQTGEVMKTASWYPQGYVSKGEAS
jgi:hypothetical protein|tara:strand:- start:141 stop:383 length:243 start_codon:yes stop_codon:yes gene_type:complete